MIPYELYYWPLPFRGHFIRYILAHVGSEWREPSQTELVRLKNAAVEDQPVPFMAPPLLHDTEAGVWLSQLPAIVMYLGRKHALVPADPPQAALAVKLICDANDVLDEITRFGGREMWTSASWRDFRAGRLVRWMEIFEAHGRAHGLTAEDGFLLGTEDIGLADLITAALWHTLASKLPPLGAILATHAPAVAGLTRRVAERNAIAAMLKREDARMGELYCGGQIEKSLRRVLAKSPATPP